MLYRDYPELVPACGWASVHVLANILLYLLKVRDRLLDRHTSALTCNEPSSTSDRSTFVSVSSHDTPIPSITTPSHIVLYRIAFSLLSEPERPPQSHVRNVYDSMDPQLTSALRACPPRSSRSPSSRSRHRLPTVPSTPASSLRLSSTRP